MMMVFEKLTTVISNSIQSLSERTQSTVTRILNDLYFFQTLGTSYNLRLKLNPNFSANQLFPKGVTITTLDFDSF